MEPQPRAILGDPQAVQLAAGRPCRPEAEASPQPRSPRVLIVDDSRLVRAALSSSLTVAGYEVDAVDDGAVALGLLDGGSYDIVLTDLQMPVVDGFAVLEAVKALDPDIEVVVLTGEYADDSEAIVRALRLGADDFLGKSASSSKQILRSVGQALERRRQREQLKMAETLYRHAEARYRQLLEQVQAIVWRASADGLRFTFVSPEAERILGYPAEKWSAQGFWIEHIHPEDRAGVVAHCQAAVDERRPHNCEFRMITADNRTVWLKDCVRAVVEEGVTELVGVMTDVTERKLLEEKLRHAQRMEAFGQLAGGVAHDFNNILGVIVGYGDLLLSSLPASDPRRERVDRIRAAADSGAALTRQLLAFSRKQVLHPCVLDLTEVVSELEPMLHRLIGENIQLLITASRHPCRTEADHGQIEQVVLNLVVNARDAMPSGGKLLVETAQVDLDEAGARFHARFHPNVRPGPYVRLSVSDTGTGMDDSVLSRIFEPFFTTKEPGKGTGLGLATVFGIVEQSAGHIAVYSEVGRGSSFRVYLPAVLDPQQKAEPAVAETYIAAQSHGTETVFVVEDDESLRDITRELLTQAGYTVLDAPGPASSLALLDSHVGPIHLLVTDVIMPGGTGPELARDFVRRSPSTRVLYMSGYPGEIIGHHHLLGPEAPLLEKPFTNAQLLTIVREVLDQPERA